MEGRSKTRLIAESCVPGVPACSVARRHGLALQQLFTWRRLARKPAEVPSVPGRIQCLRQRSLCCSRSRSRRRRGGSNSPEAASGTLRASLIAFRMCATSMAQHLGSG
ncbi:transposase [Rhizobium leguminosarum]|uniref:transposase n=1 Tax=Rhizobium leguminosarum TaxID=384 RepID=UPI003F9C441C